MKSLRFKHAAAAAVALSPSLSFAAGTEDW